ncbi:hypothetical protein GW17_00034587, partial [Ensete ventricosum]
ESSFVPILEASLLSLSLHLFSSNTRSPPKQVGHTLMVVVAFSSSCKVSSSLFFWAADCKYACS